MHPNPPVNINNADDKEEERVDPNDEGDPRHHHGSREIPPGVHQKAIWAGIQGLNLLKIRKWPLFPDRYNDTVEDGVENGGEGVDLHPKTVLKVEVVRLPSTEEIEEQIREDGNTVEEDVHGGDSRVEEAHMGIGDSLFPMSTGKRESIMAEVTGN